MKEKSRYRIAFIGGSGLYGMKAIADAKEVRVKTPFGEPSGPIVVGKLGGVDCAFLPRHGRGHALAPFEVNGRANIWALKSLGAERVVGMTAVGSLKEELAPRHFVFPDQLVDETKYRRSTFFGDGVVAHAAFDRPFCAAQSEALLSKARALGITSHAKGTYICMEGPAFSTKAESECHRRQGYDIIGMTAVPEAKLAREAELCYSIVALVTDYDCWKEGEEVSSSKVIENLGANTANVQKLLEAAAADLSALKRDCHCGQALSNAIFTQPQVMNKKTLKKLDLLIGKYVKR